MADNRLSTFLPDDKAAFGVFPQMKPRRRLQDVQGSANVPLDVTRGRLAGLLGLPADLANLLQSPMPTEMFGNTQYEPAQQLPYGSEYFLKNLPLAPTSRVGEVAGQAGAFVPLNPMPAARAAAAGVKALGPTAGRMAEGYLQRTGGILPLDVYHGSPYKFDAFDASKIGSGEGAQVYGHGLYFAEAPEVAKGYQSTLGHKGALDLEHEAIQRGIPLSREARIEFMRQSMRDMPPKITVKNLQNANIEARSLDEDKLAGLVKDYKESKQGSLYKVDLPDEKIAKMLDYDKPLSEQHPDVRAALMDHPAIVQNVAERAGIQQRLNEQYPDRLTHPVLGKMANREIVKDDITGREIYEALSSHFDDRKAASQYLNQQGIPGIKYLDEGSRNLANTWIVRHPQGGENVFSSKASAEAYLKRNPEETLIEPKVTRNFVTFPGEEKNLTILERNGQPSRNSLNSFIR